MGHPQDAVIRDCCSFGRDAELTRVRRTAAKSSWPRSHTRIDGRCRGIVRRRHEQPAYSGTAHGCGWLRGLAVVRNGSYMSLVRVQSFSVSLDGFGTGEGQSLDTPFGHAGHRLHEWMFATTWGTAMFGRTGGSRGLDDAFARQFGDASIGAEIMGALKFGPPGWQEDPEWKGW